MTPTLAHTESFPRSPSGCQGAGSGALSLAHPHSYLGPRPSCRAVTSFSMSSSQVRPPGFRHRLGHVLHNDLYPLVPETRRVAPGGLEDIGEIVQARCAISHREQSGSSLLTSWRPKSTSSL